MPRSKKGISLKLIVDGEVIYLYLNNLRKALNRIGKKVVSNARKVLKQQKKVVTGNLSKSLYYTIEGTDEGIELLFEGHAPYWDFVEQGVKGLISNAKAPDSPYKFGSGNFEGTGTLRGGIDRWVIQKPIKGIRDSKGKFIPRKQMVSAISTKIYNYGIEPSNFYTIALDQGEKKNLLLISKAIGVDVTDFVEENMTGLYNISITI
tara:strand:- start:2867 stop:3484 length:618 start_codon:yes stop_codon:yes gene_type:complete